MGDKARARITVKGRVQGVFFRSTTVETALEMGGITGWVKNMPNGDVEATAEGDRDKIEKLIKWCQKGPPSARVSSVAVEWEEFVGEFDYFEVRY